MLQVATYVDYFALRLNIITDKGVLTMIKDDEQTYPTILRMREVERRTGYKKSHIYELIKNNQFPPSIRIGVRSVGWNSTEIDHWIAERLANVN